MLDEQMKRAKEKIALQYFEKGDFEKALSFLLSYDNKDIRIKCHYELGKKSAGEDYWANAQFHFKELYGLGVNNVLIQQRLSLLSNLLMNPIKLFDYYINGRERKTLHVPDLDIDAYAPLVDLIICVGVYKWAGDQNAYDDWSRLLRRIKKGSYEVMEAAKIAGITLLQCMSKETHIRKEVDLIIPIPPDPERIKERNFNIPTLIADIISRSSSIPMFENILIKLSSTVKRAAESVLLRVMSVKNPEQIKDRVVLLIDDITTHGDTFRACARRLKDAGAIKVYAAALAHSEPTSMEWW